MGWMYSIPPALLAGIGSIVGLIVLFRVEPKAPLWIKVASALVTIALFASAVVAGGRAR